jgi:hypothetical protein
MLKWFTPRQAPNSNDSSREVPSAVDGTEAAVGTMSTEPAAGTFVEGDEQVGIDHDHERSRDSKYEVETNDGYRTPERSSRSQTGAAVPVTNEGFNENDSEPDDGCRSIFNQDGVSAAATTEGDKFERLCDMLSAFKPPTLSKSSEQARRNLPKIKVKKACDGYSASHQGSDPSTALAVSRESRSRKMSDGYRGCHQKVYVGGCAHQAGSKMIQQDVSDVGTAQPEGRLSENDKFAKVMLSKPVSALTLEGSVSGSDEKEWPCNVSKPVFKIALPVILVTNQWVPVENKKSWIFDGAVCDHITNDMNDLFDVETLPESAVIFIVGNNKTMRPTHVGKVQFGTVTLTEVYLCVSCPFKLISESRLILKGVDINKFADTGMCECICQGIMIFTASMSEGTGLFVLNEIRERNGMAKFDSATVVNESVYSIRHTSPVVEDQPPVSAQAAVKLQVCNTKVPKAMTVSRTSVVNIPPQVPMREHAVSVVTPNLLFDSDDHVDHKLPVPVNPANSDCHRVERMSSAASGSTMLSTSDQAYVEAPDHSVDELIFELTQGGLTEESNAAHENKVVNANDAENVNVDVCMKGYEDKMNELAASVLPLLLLHFFGIALAIFKQLSIVRDQGVVSECNVDVASKSTTVRDQGVICDGGTTDDSTSKCDHGIDVNLRSLIKDVLPYPPVRCQDQRVLPTQCDSDQGDAVIENLKFSKSTTKVSNSMLMTLINLCSCQLQTKVQNLFAELSLEAQCNGPGATCPQRKNPHRRTWYGHG